MPTEETSTTAPASTPTPNKSNNKTLLIAGVVILILVLAGVGYYVFGKSDKNSGNKTNTSATTDSSSGSSKSSIKDLIFKRKNVTCSVKYPDGSGSGTVYVSDKKFYGEFTTITDGKTTKGYVMQDGNYSYIWSDDSDQGFKVKLTDEDKANAPSAVDLEEEGDTNCSNWSVDNSKFTAPSNITFLDFTPTTTQ